jgi:hypothetical protein
MNKIIRYVSLTGIALLLTLPVEVMADVVIADTRPDIQSNIATELTSIFRAARQVVSSNQSHMNKVKRFLNKPNIKAKTPFGLFYLSITTNLVWGVMVNPEAIVILRVVKRKAVSLVNWVGRLV